MFSCADNWTFSGQRMYFQGPLRIMRPFKFGLELLDCRVVLLLIWGHPAWFSTVATPCYITANSVQSSLMPSWSFVCGVHRKDRPRTKGQRLFCPQETTTQDGHSHNSTCHRWSSFSWRTFIPEKDQQDDSLTAQHRDKTVGPTSLQKWNCSFKERTIWKATANLPNEAKGLSCFGLCLPAKLHPLISFNLYSVFQQLFLFPQTLHALLWFGAFLYPVNSAQNMFSPHHTTYIPLSTWITSRKPQEKVWKFPDPPFLLPQSCLPLHCL